MNSHIKQIYSFYTKHVPLKELKIYIAAYGILDEIEHDYDGGLNLQHGEVYRYKNIQYFINTYCNYGWPKRFY